MNWIVAGAIILAVAVIFGAFGAHALKDRLDPYSLTIWEKAVFYHFVHGLGILLVASLVRSGALPAPSGTMVNYLLAVGILLFSGSLYALALSGVRMLGAVTPLGGLSFIAAWVVLAWKSV